MDSANNIEKIREIVTYGSDTRVLEWLAQFEDQSGPAVVEQFLKELYQREASLQDFWLIYIYSYTSNVQDNLDLLDRVRAGIRGRRPLTSLDLVDELGKSRLLE